MTFHNFECASCSRPFTAVNATAETCSPACRQRRYKERQATRAVAAASLLHRQSALIVRMTSAFNEADRARLLVELDALAREAAVKFRAVA